MTKNFISFHKRKGFLAFPSSSTVDNSNLVCQLNNELMNNGFMLSKDAFDTLSTNSTEFISEIYKDIVSGLNDLVGGDGYVAIYENFPNSVIELSQFDLYINAIRHYWSYGEWKPNDSMVFKKDFAIEDVKFKEISIIEQSDFDSIFTDIVYSGKSISHTDKSIVDWFLSEGYTFNFKEISFKETKAYIGQRLMDDSNIAILPTKDATQILRIWAAYSGGDEGLKVNCKFIKPSTRQKKVLLKSLNECYNLEDSFKSYREIWLKLLFYLNPLSNKNRRYNNLRVYTDALRNNPRELMTFNSKVEFYISTSNVAIFELLAKRLGVFTRKLDHLIRIFGATAFDKWITLNPNTENLINAYNHFTDRDKETDGRSAVLASQSVSDMVTYKAHKPLSNDIVEYIKSTIMDKLKEKTSTLKNKKVYVDSLLYLRPINANNRASSFSLTGAVNGTITPLTDKKCIRTYVHWHDKHDIDLSGLVITKNNNVKKIGWNGDYKYIHDSIIYSGDNTGHSDKNAEYLDINIDKLPFDVEWVIAEARIYRGPETFKNFPNVKMGWMEIDNPNANNNWQPKTLSNSMDINSDSNNIYLYAIHIPTNSFVYLDLSSDGNIVSSNEDALKMRIYLQKFVTSKSDGISWDKINQGHLINLLSGELVEKPEDADVVFDEKATYEEVVKFL